MVIGMQLTHDPSISSYYVNDTLYQELVDSFSDWQRDDLAVNDPSERDRFRMLIEREARLLDQLRFDEWLAMYSPECIYWVPGTPAAGDPRREIAISFDDRRRMEDRIYRLRTGYAWSQAPRSRTVRMISNTEVFATNQGNVRMVRSNFLISELLYRSYRPTCPPSWPGLSRPSTSCFPSSKKDVDARDKRGHDGEAQT